MKATIIAGLISSSIALDAQAACQSACGLVASADACKLAIADKGNCKMLLTNGETLKYSEKATGGFHPLTVIEATELISAPYGNCFAMCYENAACKPVGSYCTAGGVCPNLYWNKYSNLNNVMEYSYYDGSSSINTDAAVLCDYKTSEQPVNTEDLPGYVDPCPAVCALSHPADECLLVQRSNGVCHRLYWTDAARVATKFMVQTPINEVAVTVEEAFELLKEPSCEQACETNAHCTASYCNQDNRTCKELFYVPGAPVKSDLSICFGARCKSDAIPVMCELPGDKKGAINGNRTPASFAEADTETTTKSGATVLFATLTLLAFL